MSCKCYQNLILHELQITTNLIFNLPFYEYDDIKVSLFITFNLASWSLNQLSHISDCDKVYLFNSNHFTLTKSWCPGPLYGCSLLVEQDLPVRLYKFHKIPAMLERCCYLCCFCFLIKKGLFLAYTVFMGPGPVGRNNKRC